MLRNYLVAALRNFRRNKASSIINVMGLSLGLACSFMIVLWVQDEMSVDNFHKDSNQIYRVLQHSTFGGVRRTSDSLPKPLDDVLNEEYPEITNSILMDWGSTMVLSLEDDVFRADGRYFDADVFSVFTFPFLIGDPETALLDPESITISESLAEMFFGDDWQSKDDLLGTIVRVDNRIDMKLTGVFEDVPNHSSIQFDFILPVEEYIGRNDWLESWGSNALLMFVRLREDADAVQVNAKIKDLIDEHIDSWESDIWLQPLPDVYLRSGFENGVVVGGRIEYVRIFLVVAVILILIASINFMNLATARSARRAREIGIRKSVGATRSLLARQFLGESILTAMGAYVIAIGLLFLFLPGFNGLTNKAVSLSFLDSRLWLQFFGLALLTGLLAGSYPALYLSSFNVVGVLRSRVTATARGGGLRKGLVVFQFIMSIVLIVGTVTVYKQLSYIRAKDLGVDRHNVVSVDLEGGVREQFDVFKQELLKEPGIVNVATASSNPLSTVRSTINPRWDGKLDDDKTSFFIISVGHDFIETMKIDLFAGRHFSEDFGADSSNFIINEKAAEAMGMDDPIGQSLSLWNREGTIVGLVKDFHVRSLYGAIRPVIIQLDPVTTSMLFVRTATGQTSEALTSLERVYSRFNPEYPFNYRFMDEEFVETYRSEIVIGTLAKYFAILAVFIACLGLFGLASFTTEQRTKEIGIRKVLGATVSNVVILLSRDFILLVVGASVVAAPIAYVLMTDWLNKFAFHMEFGAGIMVGACAAAVAIAWLTVSYQSIRAATTNPVISLRSE